MSSQPVPQLLSRGRERRLRRRVTSCASTFEDLEAFEAVARGLFLGSWVPGFGSDTIFSLADSCRQGLIAQKKAYSLDSMAQPIEASFYDVLPAPVQTG